MKKSLYKFLSTVDTTGYAKKLTGTWNYGNWQKHCHCCGTAAKWKRANEYLCERCYKNHTGGK